jgi:hypothetical protein
MGPRLLPFENDILRLPGRMSKRSKYCGLQGQLELKEHREVQGLGRRAENQARRDT